MIDTVRFSIIVNEDIKIKVESTGKLFLKFDYSTGEILCNILVNQVECSYSSNLTITFRESINKTYVMFVEGSLQKVLLGQNSYNGFTNLLQICKIMLNIVIKYYQLDLKYTDNDLVLERVDIARVYDLENQNNVFDYLYSISTLTYPRRKVMYFQNESIYVKGRTTTLKIYNKLLEFRKHDRKKFLNQNNFADDENRIYNFDLFDYENKIKGYLRFECEIHKRLLGSNVLVKDMNYEKLLRIWESEFMKLYSFNTKNEKINDKILVKNRLVNMYGNTTGNTLYDFWLRLVADGETFSRNVVTKSTFYRKRKLLQDAGIDFSKHCDLVFADTDTILGFSPFTSNKEVC